MHTFVALIFMFIMANIFMNDAKADQHNKENKDFHITFDEKSYLEKHEIRFNGVYGTFVNCGSQYAIWHQFPQAMQYKVKDLDSGKVYISIDKLYQYRRMAIKSMMNIQKESVEKWSWKIFPLY